MSSMLSRMLLLGVRWR